MSHGLTTTLVSLAITILILVGLWYIITLLLDPYRATDITDLPALRSSLVKWEKCRTDSLADGRGYQAREDWCRIQQIRKAIRRHERTLAKQGKAATGGGS